MLRGKNLTGAVPYKLVGNRNGEEEHKIDLPNLSQSLLPLCKSKVKGNQKRKVNPLNLKGRTEKPGTGKVAKRKGQRIIML